MARNLFKKGVDWKSISIPRNITICPLNALAAWKLGFYLRSASIGFMSDHVLRVVCEITFACLNFWNNYYLFTVLTILWKNNKILWSKGNNVNKTPYGCAVCISRFWLAFIEGRENLFWILNTFFYNTVFPLTNLIIKDVFFNLYFQKLYRYSIKIIYNNNGFGLSWRYNCQEILN